ncbi:Basic leucine zipper transcriptional factor ATF-like 3 [Liparis tanakae]|uniref:Basic leucine zipper transcriptional factor ATF-like 3 n=1 Tax=Liparis tanakae TaxID=230148 RepID=A0A4Z2J4F6_9TELE|nr:Basic leucine zipper transcriptional factor ATF-like 3 [Liparis tanakae]
MKDVSCAVDSLNSSENLQVMNVSGQNFVFIPVGHLLLQEIELSSCLQSSTLSLSALSTTHTSPSVLSNVLMLKPSVGEMVLTSSPLNFFRMVVFPALSRPLHEPGFPTPHSEDSRPSAGEHIVGAVFERSPGAEEARSLMRPLHTSHGRGLARVSASLQQRRPAMSPLFMDTGCELNSPSSVSAEGSNTAESEREEEGEPTGRRGRIKQEKNKNAARKSRRKQTKRADELHEFCYYGLDFKEAESELQGLERFNSAIKKEIAALKKDLDSYTAALERHEPSCCLRGSAAASSSSAGPSRDAPGASLAASPAGPSLSTSLTPKLGLQPSVQSARFSPVTPPAATTSASPHGSSAGPFASSSSVTAPDSVSFSAAPTPRSPFGADFIALRPTHVPPVCTGLVSHSAVSRSGHPSVLDDFLMTQASFLAASSNAVPFNSQSAAENAGQDRPVSLACSLSPPALHDPSPKSLSMSCPAPVFASKPSCSEQVALSHSSLLSMLGVPSPLNASQTTSSSFDEPVPQPPPSLGDPSRDLSLSELLDRNEWILSGTSHL